MQSYVHLKIAKNDKKWENLKNYVHLFRIDQFQRSLAQIQPRFFYFDRFLFTIGDTRPFSCVPKIFRVLCGLYNRTKLVIEVYVPQILFSSFL